MSTPVLACLVGREADRTGCCGGYTGRPLVLHATNKQHRLRRTAEWLKHLEFVAELLLLGYAPALLVLAARLHLQTDRRIGLTAHTGQVLLQATACGCSSGARRG